MKKIFRGVVHEQETFAVTAFSVKYHYDVDVPEYKIVYSSDELKRKFQVFSWLRVIYLELTELLCFVRLSTRLFIYLFIYLWFISRRCQ
jgi:hypothetical protein